MADRRWVVVFVDTSILVAKVVREPAMKARIKSWLDRFQLKVSGRVALQEFKSRVLRDVAYLLYKLNQTGSYMATLNHVTNVLPRQAQRKQRICLPLLHQVLPGGTSDQELTERARLYLRTLLVYGQKHIELELDALQPSITCYWSTVAVVEKRPYSDYDFGDRKCSKSRGRCQISEDLQARMPLCRRLLAFIQALPPERVTTEIDHARTVLDKVVNGEIGRIDEEDPCLTAGDLLLALDSEPVREFYTMNYRESQAYCDALGQNLTIRPNDPARDEEEYLASARPWPSPKAR